MKKYLVIILLILLVYTVYQCWKLATVTTEGFADASVPTNVDTNNSIATLAQLATDLQSGGGLKVPGKLDAQNGITVKNGIYLKPRNDPNGGTGFEFYSPDDNWLGIYRDAKAGNIMTLDKTGNMNLSGSITANRINILAPGGQNTHFPHTDGKNYIRGPTQQDGELTVNGGLNVSGRNILAELDALKATNAALRADLDARTKYVVTQWQAPLPPGYTEGGLGGGPVIHGNGWVHWAQRP